VDDTAADLAKFLKSRSAPSLTITLPTFRTMPDAQQNPIRFKNLIARAEETLAEQDISDETAAALLNGARGLIDDYDFWQHQRDGLAYLASDGEHRLIKLAADLPESVHVGEGFALRPFLPLLKSVPEYYVLAAASGKVRLFRGGRYSLTQLDDDAFAESLHDFDMSGTPGGDTPPPSAENFGLSGPDAQEKLRELFAEALARAMDGFLADKDKAKLVLIADERLAGAFTGAVEDKLIVTPETQVSPAHLDADALFDIAWDALNATIDGKQEDSPLNRFQAHFGDAESSLAVTGLAEIGEAAAVGRIEYLLIEDGADIAGTLADDGSVDRDGDGDLVEALAHRVFNSGGAVEAVDSDALPGVHTIAALLRW